jgi:hypothetical protein
MPLPTLEPLLQKEMDRKEFLITLGLGLASIFGFSTIIHMLTGKTVGSHINKTMDHGYGSTNYGEDKE